MENNFEEINLSELITILAKKWWALITSALLCIIISAIFTFFIADPVYQSDTSIYVGKELSAQSAIAYNDLILADRLVNDYRELVKSRLVTGMVIEKLGLNMTSGELAKKINVTSIKDTRLIQITAEILILKGPRILPIRLLPFSGKGCRNNGCRKCQGN